MSDFVSFRVEDKTYYITKTKLKEVAPDSLLYHLATTELPVDKTPDGAILLEVPLDTFLIVYRTILDQRYIDYDKNRSHSIEFDKRLKETFAYLGIPIPPSPYLAYGPTISNGMRQNNHY